MSERRIAAVDVGSTRLKYAVGTPDGSFYIEPRHRQTGEAVVDSVIDAVAELRAESAIDAVSVVTTGLIDSDSGTVTAFDTADGTTLRDVPLTAAVAEAFDLPTYLLNDCNAAAVGEWTYGAGADYDTVVYVTMATGIGAGIVSGGQLLDGEHGQAGEVGLLSLAPLDGLASEGVAGAWEAYCSGRGLPQFTRAVLAEDDRESVLRDRPDLEAPDVFAAADEGDPVAGEIIERVGRYNSAGLAGVINVVNPGIVTLGGGVALNNPDVITDAIDRHLGEYVFVERPPVEITTLGADLELLGAIAYAELDDSEPMRTD